MACRGPVLGLVESFVKTTHVALSKGPTVPTNRRTDPEPQDEAVTEFEVPEDLTTLEPDALTTLTEQVQQAFDTFAENEDPTDDDVAAIHELGAALTELNAEKSRREAEDKRRKDDFRAAVDAVRNATGQATDEPADEAPDGDTGDAPADAPTDPEAPTETPAEPTEVAENMPEPVAASANGPRRGALRVQAPLRRPTLNPPLGDISRFAPDPGIEDLRPEVVITAAADVPRMSPGQRMATLDQLVEATIGRAKALGVTNGQPAFVPLASVNREFPVVIDERMNPDSIRAAFEAMVRPAADSREGMEALVAAGGWCAPSEIRYEFFQISEVAGLLDLPTFGVRRGGLRWPQSLSLYDFFALSGAPASGVATAATMPWLWTEADDIATVTGTGAKLCLRPPCPNFDEARLEAFGICVTAGNLTEDAFPELIRHFIAQTVVAHARAMNRRHIALVVAASTATTPTSAAGQSAAAHILGGFALNATDYREKHGMRPGAVLEGVLPVWALELMRSDIAKMNGGETIDRLNLADAQIRDFFDTRGIRMQWVQDWQTRGANGIAPVSGTAPTNWPTSALGLLYAPGTFGRGNGMTLDLGVVRDSVLNAENDHTAAWSEEATLVAKFGHESRVITFANLEATGHTGDQAALTDGP